MMIDFEINDKGTLVWNDGSSRPATHQEQELTYEIAYRDDQIKALQAEVERLKSGRTRIPVDERSPVEDGRYVVQLTAVTDLGTSKYTDVAFWVGEWSIHDNEARVTHWIDENLDSGLVEGTSK